MTDFRSRIVDEARSCLEQPGPEPWAREAGLNLGPGDRPSWCGLFVRAIWARAGLKVPPWKIGSGNTKYLTRRTGAPEPGDLACFLGELGHQAIVLEDKGECVRVCNGNGVGGVVTETLAHKSRISAFFDPSCLFPKD